MDAANPPREPAPETIFSAVIRPHRSLSPQGFLLLMIVVGLTSAGAGLIFLAMGAWPVFGIFGLDALIIYLAFRANYRTAQAAEYVDVTTAELVVRRVTEKGAVAEWRLNPYWARLAIEQDEDGVVTGLGITSHGRTVPLAGWLSPPERRSFAEALGQALALARRGGA